MGRRRRATGPGPATRYHPAMTRVPSLGQRGEGWVAIQFVLIGLAAVAGVAGAGAWTRELRYATTVVGALLGAAGLILAVRGIVDLRTALTPFPRPLEGAPLVEHGAYALVRHPIYAGIIVGSLGWGLVLASPLALLASVALLVLFDLKSRREEAWLLESQPGYAAYCRRTRKFIPGLY